MTNLAVEVRHRGGQLLAQQALPRVPLVQLHQVEHHDGAAVAPPAGQERGQAGAAAAERRCWAMLKLAVLALMRQRGCLETYIFLCLSSPSYMAGPRSHCQRT